MSSAGRMPQNITRANHVLPICYQQSFTKQDGELFVQFLRQDRQPTSLHPVKVGVINDFYTRIVNGIEDDGIEKFFGKFVEGEYAGVAKRIVEQRDHFLLEKPDVSVLLKFVVTQIVRTQAHRTCIETQTGVPLPQEVFIHNMHRKMKMITDRWLKQIPEVVLWTSLPFLGAQFITGDNPVVCFSHSKDESTVQSFTTPTPKIIDLSVSLESSHNGFIVPLSPYVCLTIINSGERDSITLRPAQCTDPRVVRDFNRLIYSQCVNFVAAQDPQHLLAARPIS